MSNIKKLNEDLDELNDDWEELQEFVNLASEDTGVPVAICIIPESGKEKHKKPRIKVMPHPGKVIKSELVPVTLDKEPEVLEGCYLDPRILKKVKAYINLNYDVLMRYYRDPFYIGTKIFIDSLQSIDERY